MYIKYSTTVFSIDLNLLGVLNMDKRKNIRTADGGIVPKDVANSFQTKLNNIKQEFYAVCERVINTVDKKDSEYVTFYHLVKDGTTLGLYRGINPVLKVQFNSSNPISLEQKTVVDLGTFLNNVCSAFEVDWQSIILPYEKGANLKDFGHTRIYLEGAKLCSFDFAMKSSSVYLVSSDCKNLPLSMLNLSADRTSDEVECFIKNRVLVGDNLIDALSPDNGFAVIGLGVYSESSSCIVYKCDFPNGDYGFLRIEY